MGIDFTVFKGSEDGSIVESKGHRDVGKTQALVKLTHAGVCGTDEHYKHNSMGLGHEGVGVVIELGSETGKLSDLKVGDRVGMGWVQRYCGHCKYCLDGRDISCLNNEQYGTANHDEGTFGTAIAYDVSALFKIPDEIPSENAGPLICGGSTVWGPLTRPEVKRGHRVGIVGIGGLGHMAIQFASKLGLEVVVFSSTESKKEEAMGFGATEFHATKGVTKFEGIKPIDHLLITTSAQPDYSLYLPVMARWGRVYPLTISFDAVPLPMLPLVMNCISVVGTAIAMRSEINTLLEFCARHGVGPQIQKFSMTRGGVEDAMQTLRSGKMKYRGVLVVE